MMTQKKFFLLTSLSSAMFMVGCSSTPNDTYTQQLTDQRAKYEQQIQKLEAEKHTAQQQASAAEAQAQKYSALAQKPASSSSASSALFPPNAQPGQCWSRVLTPATYTTSTSNVLVKAESQNISIIPAKYESATERLLVKEASSKLVAIPPTYKTVTERVMVKPAAKRLKTIPATYETVSERILDKPAHTAWKRGQGFKSSALQTRIDNGTGEVMCLVEIPASYRTISKTVVKTPESVVEQEIPAEFRTITKRVIATEASTKSIAIPAEYKTVSVQRLVTPAKELRNTIPAKYKTVTSSEKATDEELKWAQVLCEINMTPTTVSNLQNLLRKAGVYSGPIDGQYGPMTERATNAYAKRNNLSTGSRLISLDTAKHIGLKI